jgi:hypothetical protein
MSFFGPKDHIASREPWMSELKDEIFALIVNAIRKRGPWPDRNELEAAVRTVYRHAIPSGLNIMDLFDKEVYDGNPVCEKKVSDG